MYLPRNLISHLYEHLKRNNKPLSPPVLIFVALEPDALCACRILVTLLKRDDILHKIHPISGYGDLEQFGQSLVHPMRIQNGGSGGVVVCLGVGGLVDVSIVLGIDVDEDGIDASGGVEVWLIDARRPWNLGNIFAGDPTDELSVPRGPEVIHGKIQASYRPGQGGIIVYDDGDIEQDFAVEREAYSKLRSMPELDEYGDESDDDSNDESDAEQTVEGALTSNKRKSWSNQDDEQDDSDDEENRHRRKRRSDSVRQEIVLVDLELNEAIE